MKAVFDIDSDGKGEFLVKAANGTIFGDGTTLKAPNDTDAYIVAVDGVTGAEKGTRVLSPMIIPLWERNRPFWHRLF